jgi:hypothetical protein
MRFAHLKIHHGSERMRLRGLSGARDEFHLAAFSPQQPPSTPENGASRRNDYREKYHRAVDLELLLEKLS